MSAIESLAEGIHAVDEILAEDILEPDPARSFETSRSRVGFLRSMVERDVLVVLPDALFEAQGNELGPRIERRVTRLFENIGGLLAASGDNDGARKLLGKAAAAIKDEAQKSRLGAAAAELPALAHLAHARWLTAHGKGTAQKALRRARRAAQSPALLDAIRETEKEGLPLQRAPALFTLNGFGVRLYGRRDERDDGSYVATHFICAVFVPLLPIGAYRVLDAGERGYLFLRKVPLGPIARLWLALGLAATLGSVSYGAVQSHFGSPEYKAGVAVEQARKSENAGDLERALAQYRGAIRDFGTTVPMDDAAESIARIISTTTVESPVTPASVDAIERVLNAYFDLPENARRGGAADFLSSKLSHWADELGDGDTAHADAALAVLDLATEVQKDAGKGGQEILDKQAKLRRSLADRMRAERPLGALRHEVLLGDDAALDAAKQIIDGFGEAPSLWIEAEGELLLYQQAAQNRGRSADAATVKAELEKRRGAFAEDEKLIEARDEKALAAALKERPAHQEIAVALASAALSRGDSKAAITMLSALGKPGLLTAEAQETLAQAKLAAGEDEAADVLLTTLVAERLPGFQTAQRVYRAARDKVGVRIDRLLRASTPPPDLASRIGNERDENKQREIVQAWIADEYDADSSLQAPREALLRHGAVIRASVSLGMVKLRRASTATGEAQRALLQQAERAFLAVRGEAAGSPTYHIGLGEVYHRLGRHEDGETELTALLAKKDPEIAVAVALAYRRLGLEPRARKVAEQAYEMAETPQQKQTIAFMRSSYPETLDDEETWLSRSDTSLPDVKIRQKQVQARKFWADGKEAEADRVYAEVAAFYEKDAKHDSAAANNAAMAYEARYAVTGDPAHLRAYVRLLEVAARLAGENAIVLGHLGDALEELGYVTVLEKWVDTKALRLDRYDARTILPELLDGPLRGEVLAALDASPSLRQALEIARREQVLAPQKTAAYSRELQWLKDRRDTAGLSAFRARLEAMPPFLEDDAKASRSFWTSGEHDAEIKRDTERAIKKARALVDKLEKTARGPTRAAAWLIYQRTLGPTLVWDLSKENLTLLAETSRRAAEAWPEAIVDDDAAAHLTLQAILDARASSPALSKAYDEKRRIMNALWIAHEASEGPSGAEVLAALRAQPSLEQAASKRRGNTKGNPRVSDWMLARLANDAALEKEAEAVFDRADIGHALAIEARLSPGQLAEQFEWSLFQSRGKKKGL